MRTWKTLPRSQTGSKIKASNFLGSRGCVPMVTFCSCPCALKIHIVGSWIHWVGWIGKRCPCHGCWSLVVVQQAFRLSEIFTRTSKWSWWSLRTDVNPKKSGKLLFLMKQKTGRSFFFPHFFLARLLWHDSASWFLINLMAENPHDVPRDLQIGDRSFEVFISWAFLRKPKTWWVYLPSIELPDHQDYYEFTPGILRGLCDAEHLETLQVKLEDALHGMGVTHIKGQVGSEYWSEALT